MGSTVSGRLVVESYDELVDLAGLAVDCNDVAQFDAKKRPIPKKQLEIYLIRELLLRRGIRRRNIKILLVWGSSLRLLYLDLLRAWLLHGSRLISIDLMHDLRILTGLLLIHL